MHWIRFSLLAVAVAFAGFAVEGHAPAGWPAVEWLYLLAHHVALQAVAGYAIPVFWLCGFLHDLFLGGHLGASALLFSVMAGGTLILRGRVSRDHWLPYALSLLAGLMLVSLLRPVVEIRSLAPLLLWETWQAAGLSTLVSLVFAPFIGALLSRSLVRPWQDEAAMGWGA